MRLSSAPVLTQASAVLLYPVGGWQPNSGMPSCARSAWAIGCAIDDGRVGGARHGDDELERRLHLGAVRGRREELRRRDDRAHDLTQIAFGPQECSGGPIDQRGRRLVGDEALRELERDVVRGRRMRREHVEHALALVLAVSGREALAEDDLLARVVHLRPEDEPAALLRTIDGPAGQRARHFDDVFLRVAAVDAERVQFHQLAAVVLVQAARRAARCACCCCSRMSSSCRWAGGMRGSASRAAICGGTIGPALGAELCQLSR